MPFTIVKKNRMMINNDLKLVIRIQAPNLVMLEYGEGSTT